MLNASTIDLINSTYSTDDIGQKVPIETRSTIFATIKSVAQSEFYNAGKIGLQPSLVAVTPEINYGGQTEAVYNNVRYSIYRTYVNGDSIELYLQRKAGS